MIEHPNINKSIALVGLEKFALIFFRFVSSIILARLLMPEDYGIIAMVAIYIALADMLCDAGFGGSLIYYKESNQQDYSTVFWMNTTISILLYIIFFLSADWLANFYQQQILSKVIKVLGLVFVFQALGLVQFSILNKQLEFKKLLYVSIITYLLSVIIAILLAMKGLGVWALVAQQVSSSVFRSLILFFQCRFVPSFYFSWSLIKKHWSFGSGLFFSSLTKIVHDNMYLQLSGMFCSITDAGYYNQAKKLKDIPSDLFSKTFETSLFPILSKLEDNVVFTKKFESLNVNINALCTAVFFILAICANEVVVLLLGYKWQNSSWILSWISVGAIFAVIEAINRSVLKAKGKSSWIFKIDLVKRIISILLLLVAVYYWKVFGLALSFCINSIIGWLSNVVFVSKVTNYCTRSQLRDTIKYLLYGILSSCLVLLICNWYVLINIFVSLLIKVLLFLFIYEMLLFIFKDIVFQSHKIMIKKVLYAKAK